VHAVVHAMEFNNTNPSSMFQRGMLKVNKHNCFQ